MRRDVSWWVGALSCVVVSACGGARPSTQPSSTELRAPLSPRSCTRASAHAVPLRQSSAGARQSSTVALAMLDGRTLAYVADEDRHALHTFDVDAGRPLVTTPLTGAPAQVIVLADGRVAVTLRDQNQVAVLEPAPALDRPLEARCEVTVPTEPFGLATTSDDQRLLVTSAFAQRLTVLSQGTLERRFSVKLPREPRAVLVDDDDARAFVAHVVGATMSVVELEGEDHELRPVDLRVDSQFGRMKQGKFQAKREGCQGFALAKSVDVPKALGELPTVKGALPKPAAPKTTPAAAAPPPPPRVFAPMVTVEPGEPTARASGYGAPASDPLGLEAPMVGVVDPAAERSLTRKVFADGAKRSGQCLLPRAAATSPRTGHLYVTCVGNDVLVELDARGTDPMRFERRRWSVPSGPFGLALDAKADRAVVWSQFDRKVSVIGLGDQRVATEIAMRDFDAALHPAGAKHALAPEHDLGRRLFHRTDDARISGDGRACASCHPDGREDSLTWPTPDGPRQTIMLAGRVGDGGPYSWSGQHGTLDEHVRRTFQRLGGTGLQGAALEHKALLAWVSAMPGPKVAHDGERQALVARGKELFEGGEAPCTSCHLAGQGTDKEPHALGFKGSSTPPRDALFETPTLRFVAGTAPYFHDGRYETLDDLLTGADGSMGHTFHLSRADRKALLAYLETL
jgi:hypothetical protein